MFGVASALLTPGRSTAFFAGMQFGSWTNFEAGSLANTLTIIVLPLGTLVAQRLSSNPSHFSTTVEGSGASRSSGIPLRNKAGALVSSWVTSVRRDTATIVSKIEAGGGNSTGGEKMDITDREHRSIEDIEAGSNGIRVNRKLTSREEAA